MHWMNVTQPLAFSLVWFSLTLGNTVQCMKVGLRHHPRRVTHARDAKEKVH